METAEVNEQISIILASTSPRRKQLLEQAGVSFRVLTAEVDERAEKEFFNEPDEMTKKLAEKKAGAVVQKLLASLEYKEGEALVDEGVTVVIGADTVVVLENEIFGKPHNLSEARAMLQKLSGKTHEVITAVSVWMLLLSDEGEVSVGLRTFSESSFVTFKPLSDEVITTYLRCGESFDKAGSYALQGEGIHLVENVQGEEDTVIGLPVTRLRKEFPDLFEQALE